MSELMSHGSEVTSVFQLIGTLENDITTKNIFYNKPR